MFALFNLNCLAGATFWGCPDAWFLDPIHGWIILPSSALGNQKCHFVFSAVYRSPIRLLPLICCEKISVGTARAILRSLHHPFPKSEFGERNSFIFFTLTQVGPPPGNARAFDMNRKTQKGER